MAVSGMYQVPPSGAWQQQQQQYDLEAYWQQLSYPQLLVAGGARRPRARPRCWLRCWLRSWLGDGRRRAPGR